jgi:hypothetical protein
MASLQNASICAVLATVLWTCVGLSVSSRLLPSQLAWPLAPSIGWAVHSAVALPVFCLTGMARFVVIGVFALSACFSMAVIARAPRLGLLPKAARIPVTALILAIVLSAIVMLAVLPMTVASGVALGSPIFDHSKVAMVDDMIRLGVPAGNPFFGEAGGPDRLSYYYLWHFSAAELAVVTGRSGWEADAGLTWFTAFSSLLLMMGFASWLSGRRAAALWVLALAVAATIRPVFVWLVGWKTANEFTGWPSGFGAWLFQVTWAPQHMASAGCVLVLSFLLIRIAQTPNTLLTIVFALLAVAGFESSTWIGGITFPLSAAVIFVTLFVKAEPEVRSRFAISLAAAALLAILLASPFIYDQALASVARAGGAPIGVMPYDVLGSEISEPLRIILDFPAFWTSFLFIEFAAFYPAGFVMMKWLARDQAVSPDRKIAILCFGILAIVSLGVGSMLVSRIGANNDLAWRGVLPAVLALIIASAAGLSRYVMTMRRFYAAVMVTLIAVSGFFGLQNSYRNIDFKPQTSAVLFAKSAGMWEAVRAHSNNSERIANNPFFLSEMTNWPINISWALLANRRSCYAGSDLALPFVPLPQQRRKVIDDLFVRVFDGHAEPGDIDQFAEPYHCSLVVLTPQDGAWTNDPFAASARYRLVDAKADAWRIYKRQPPTAQ